MSSSQTRELRMSPWERLSRDRLVLTVLLLLVATVVVTTTLLALRTGGADPPDRSGAETAALKAAKTSATSMTSYDYRHLDADFAWVDDAATAAFARQYRDANKPLRGVITKLKATARGSVVDAAATAVGTRKVRVVMFIDQRITDRAGGKGRVDKSRIIMSMVERDGRWLVDDIDLR